MTALPLDPVQFVRDLQLSGWAEPIRFAEVVSVNRSTRVATIRPSNAPSDGSRDVAARWLGPEPVAGALARIETYRGDVLVVGVVDAWPREAAGAVSITPSAANTPTKANITFPAGRFTQPPLVQVAANTTGPGTVVTGVSYANVTTSGCEVWLTRINTVATTVGWAAVQMTPTSAAG